MNTSSRYASLLPLVVFLSACASVSDAVTPSAVMLGEWSYASAHVVAAAPDLNTGLRVQISIDSLDGMRFWGRVTLWFVGDVGITPSAFGRVSGTVDGSSKRNNNGRRDLRPTHPLSKPLNSGTVDGKSQSLIPLWLIKHVHC